MSVLRLLLREIQHRKLSFLLALASVSLAVGVAVAVATLRDSSRREMAALMVGLEYNLIILPDGVNELDYWSSGYAKDAFMPESYIQKLTNWKGAVIRHPQARLQEMVPWRRKSKGNEMILLTGVLQIPQIGGQSKPDKQSKLAVKVERGEVVLGYLAAGLAEGAETIELEGKGAGKRLRVAGVLEAKGTVDDIRVYGHLDDVQEILGRPDEINEIQALNCLCPGVKPEDIPAFLRTQISRVLPGTHVVRIQPAAEVRRKSRAMDSRQSTYLVAAVAVACCVWVGLLALGNVRERRVEIGVLRAMGVRGELVAAMFLGKAILLGLVGAAIGWAVGTAFAAAAGPTIFHTARAKVKPAYDMLGWLLLAAPVLCALASYLPAMLAVGQDPATVLREE